MSTEPGDVSFLTRLEALLIPGADPGALRALLQRDKEALLRLAWDAAPVLVVAVREELLEAPPAGAQLLDVCADALMLLARESNAKELFVVLMEQLDRFQDTLKLRLLLPAVTQCLLRMGVQRARLVQDAVTLSLAHLTAGEADWPAADQLEGTELAALAADARTAAALQNASVVLQELLTPVQAAREQLPSAAGTPASLELSGALLRLLDRPLLRLDLSWRYAGGQPGDALALGLRCVGLLARLRPDLGAFVAQLCAVSPIQEPAASLAEAPETVTAVSDASRIALLYLLEVELADSSGAWPRVHSAAFRLRRALPPLLRLLSSSGSGAVTPRNHGLALRTALLLLHRLLTAPPPALHYDFWVEARLDALHDALMHAAVHLSTQEQRTLAVRSLDALLNAHAAPACRRRVIVRTLRCAAHASVRGFAVSQLKAHLCPATETVSAPLAWTAAETHQVLAVALRSALPSGATTDLLEQAELLLPVLNLVTLLASRHTSALRRLQDGGALEERFLAPLRLGLNMSRAHYRAELDAAQTGDGAQDAPSAAAALEVLQLDGAPLGPPPSREERVDAMRMSLTRLDLLEHVLSRTTEAVDRVQVDGDPCS